MASTPNMVPLDSLFLGDVVRLAGGGAFMDATVTCLNPDGSVRVFRPFVRTDDFSHSAGVTPYMGFEDFCLHGHPVELIKHGPLLK
jgi:hypothetical protein